MFQWLHNAAAVAVVAMAATATQAAMVVMAVMVMAAMAVGNQLNDYQINTHSPNMLTTHTKSL